ncbi:hypothetical protein BZG36_03340 [Bifiguratus adelaidae]|uniref:Ubiquitin fusion degradation protein 1 n=1 Tax=Bifiguratus adelaidae TaxID=1938954 RepID=A0A261XWM2_9FUNG|nr:hypothetical protein BZG36_03340 [Bifiguratus adelaidae]
MDNDEDAFDQLRYGMGGRGFGSFLNPNRGFTEEYKAYPVAMMQGNERENVNFGGKVIMPPSALAKLAQLNIQYPMLFELTNTDNDRHSHAGVLEFIAEEGRIYLPQWMMQTLLLEPGNYVQLKNTSLPLGSYVRIQPQSVNFLDISDPRAVLENALRNFSTLTKDDIIQINYNSKIFEIKVLKVRPDGGRSGGVSIVETDLEVDFAPPVGYVEPPRPAPTSASTANKMVIDTPPPETDEFFKGTGQRLSNKPQRAQKGKNKENAAPPSTTHQIPPALHLPFGQLFFGFPTKPYKSHKCDTTEDAQQTTGAFSGHGQSLRRKPGSATSSGTASPDSKGHSIR